MHYIFAMHLTGCPWDAAHFISFWRNNLEQGMTFRCAPVHYIFFTDVWILSKSYMNSAPYDPVMHFDSSV